MNDNMLTKFILSFLVHKEDYVKLDSDQQQLIFLTCKTIMMAIYNSIKYENVRCHIHTSNDPTHATPNQKNQHRQNPYR